MTPILNMIDELDSGVRRATLSDIWPLLDVLLMQSPPPERKAPALERVNVSIRPLNPNAWPQCPACGKAAFQCECEDTP